MAIEEWREQQKAKGAPFCDTCGYPAVWTEGHGWLHSTPENPFGAWRDERGHEVTAREWSRTPVPGKEF